MKHSYFLIIAFLILACDDESALVKVNTIGIIDSLDRSRYVIPEDVSDGWETTSLDSVGMDIRKMENMSEKIKISHPEIDGIIVVRNTKLVFEEYFNGYDRYKLHTLQSVTKSIDGILTGIAIEQGFVGSVEGLIYDYLPQYHYLDWSNRKDEIKIRHLLTMTSGLDCAENCNCACNGSGLNNSYDWAEYTLSASMNDVPGASDSYFTGLNVLAHKVIEHCSGLSLDDFSDLYLFSPLGISNYKWIYSPSREELQIHTTPRNMAKLGQLYLSKGTWNGQRLISEAWVEESTRTHVEGFWGSQIWDYGYWWWIFRPDNAGYGVNYYTALGAGGQYIIVIPSLDMVVAFTGNQETGAVLQLLDEYILDAVK